MTTRNLVFVLLFLYKFSFAQDCIYEEYGINEGIPSSETYSVYQTKNGIIWIATDRGLANFNGYEIKTFGVKDGILNPVVLDFHPQKDGTIYCATFDNQLFYFNEKFDGFTPYPYNNLLKSQLKPHQFINSIYKDAMGNLHISCSYMKGIMTISKDGKIDKNPENFDRNQKSWLHFTLLDKNVPFFFYSNDSIEKQTINNVKFNIKKHTHNNAISLQNNKRFVFKDNNKLYLVDEHGKLIKEIVTDKRPILVKKIDENHFFTGYYFGGGVIRDAQGNIVDQFLEDKYVSNFLIDHDGGYWFSTLHNGVFYVKEPKIRSIKTNVNSPIWTLTKNKNELYVGYITGEVVNIKPDYSFTKGKKFTDNYKALVEYDTINNQLYVHSGGIFYREKEDNKKIYFTDSLLKGYAIKLSEPTKKGLLISNPSQLIILGSKETTRIDIGHRVEDAAYWKDEIYIGTQKGVYVYKNDRLHSLEMVHPIFKNRVDDIDVNEEKNKIYFATLGAGIIIYDKKTEEIQTITEQDGLSNNIINELYINTNQELWACTNSGLNKIKFFENNTFEISGLRSSNGLLNDGVNDVEIINNTVWIASRKGLIVAPKELFDTEKTTSSYYLNVKTCYVNDTIAELEKLQNLSYKENRIEFLVEGISFKASNELLYKYTMEGLDEKWYYTRNRNITYPSLPYGNYTLKLAVTRQKKNENLTYVEIPIRINPPFWKQIWFVLLVVFSILLLLYLFFKYRILSYNRHIIRELLRLLIKKIKRKEKYFTFKEAGKEIRIKTDTILYIKSAGNYVEVVTEKKSHTIRTKIGEFINLMPDPLEYLRIHRSYIVRIDKVAEKDTKEVTINGQKLPVSNSYATELNKLIF